MKSIKYEILFEDEHLVAAVKPGGILVHRSTESKDKTFFLQELRNQMGGNWLYPAHRLDRAASGVMLFARSSKDASALQKVLHSSNARKEYLTFVRGETDSSWVVERPLTKSPGKIQDSKTSFEKIFELQITKKLKCTLVRAVLHTGRRHQIRRHLAGQRNFIIGDTTYGKGGINGFLRQEYKLPRLFLHAAKLTLRHPVINEELCLSAPLPEDLRKFLLGLPGIEQTAVESL